MRKFLQHILILLAAAVILAPSCRREGPRVIPRSKLAKIYADLNTIIDHFHPDEMAVEELFFTNNITTGIRVAEARGIVLLCGEQKGIRISEYTPMQVKQAVVGYGKAEKKQVITMVTSILKLPAPPKPDDTADALAIAICDGHYSDSILRR